MSGRPRPEPGDVVAAVSIGGLLLLVAVLGRHLWFFSDDWNILADYHSGNLLEPFNGHLSAVPAGAYQLLFHTAGLGSYWPYRIVGLIGLGALGVATYRFARPRVGAWPAALACTLVIWGSGGVTNVMFPFLVNFSLPIALLVAMWVLLDRDSARADVLASVCLAIALATSGLGVLAMGAIGIELAWTRAPLRRWATFAPPVLLWGIWYLGHRIDSPGDHGPGSVVSYALRMLWGGCTALAAGWKPGGVVIGLAFVALLVVAGVRWRAIDGRVLGALSAPLLFAGLTAFTRLNVVPAIPPDEFRYRWTIAAGMVLMVVCLWRSDRPAPTVGRWAPLQLVGLAAAGLLAVAGAVVLVGDMQDWNDTVVAAAPGLQAEVFASEATAGRTPDDHVLPLSYVPVTQGAYLDAIADVGSPIEDLDPATFGGSEDHRLSADRLLAESIVPTTRIDAVDLPSCAPYVSGDPLQPGAALAFGPSGATGAVRVARFSEDGVPVDATRLDRGLAVVVLPLDARGTPSGGPPYRVFSEMPTQVCPTT